MTASDIHKALRLMWPSAKGEWVYIRELRVSTGYSGGSQQFIDGFAINCWPSNAVRIAVEIKCSRGDFLNELSKPFKRTAAYRASNMLYFVVPEGLVKPKEVPPDCGLIEVKDGKARVTLEAPWHDGDSPSWMFLASVARHLDRRTESANKQAEAVKPPDFGIEYERLTEPNV